MEMRGFTAAGADLRSFAAAWSEPQLLSDPYRPLPVYRGVSLSASFAGCSVTPAGSCLLEPPPCLGSTACGVSKYEIFDPCILQEQRAEAQATQDAEGFAPGDLPPCLPQDPLFQLATTCLYIRTAAVHQLGNRLLGFLRDRLAAPGLKLRRAKFTAKAEVCHQFGDCTVKVRVYSVAAGLFAVELQRRAGDVVAFTSTFRQLAEHLEDYQPIEDLLTDSLALLSREGASAATAVGMSQAPDSAQARHLAAISQACHRWSATSAPCQIDTAQARHEASVTRIHHEAGSAEAPNETEVSPDRHEAAVAQTRHEVEIVPQLAEQRSPEADFLVGAQGSHVCSFVAAMHLREANCTGT